jgi:hypothetical protein
MPPEAASRPSGEKAQQSTQLVWPLSVHTGVWTALASKLGVTTEEIKGKGIKIVRKSFDARRHRHRGPPSSPTTTNSTQPLSTHDASFSYVVDVDLGAEGMRTKLKPEVGRLERVVPDEPFLLPRPPAEPSSASAAAGPPPAAAGGGRLPVAIVGCGPAGLFAALALAEAGVPSVVFERGQPVEKRGADIGGLLHRRLLQPDSNFCFGEGGAGTWSDGKLTTRIGRNRRVRVVDVP